MPEPVSWCLAVVFLADFLAGFYRRPVPSPARHCVRHPRHRSPVCQSPCPRFRLLALGIHFSRLFILSNLSCTRCLLSLFEGRF